MRLIDADAFIEKLAHVPMVQEAIKKAMDTMPTVDAVPVTRCKDCEWYDPVNDCYGNCTREGYDEQWYMVYATDFCSMPKRKEHETNRR